MLHAHRLELIVHHLQLQVRHFEHGDAVGSEDRRNPFDEVHRLKGVLQGVP